MAEGTSRDLKDYSVEDYIDCAEKFISLTKDLASVQGSCKLQRMCRAELKYLQNLKKNSSDVCLNHLKSSNLSHFAGILHAAYSSSRVTRLLSPFSLPGRTESLVVDVVANQGGMWVKVVARKAQALHLIWAGKGQFGERDLIKQAKDYIRCAASYPCNFQVPRVCFAFYNNVTFPMATALEDLGITVIGQRVNVDPDVSVKIQMSSSDDSDSDIDSDDDEEPLFLSESLQCNMTMDLNENNPNCIETDVKHSKNVIDFSKDTNSHHHLEKDKCKTVCKHYVDLNQCKNESDHYRSECCCKSAKPDLFPNVRLISYLITSFPVFYNSEELSEGISVNDNVQRVNLDITSMITLVSALTNGGSHYVFQEKILSQQASEERRHPVLPSLQRFLKGKELLACQTAVNDFQKILNTLGGPVEKIRAKELLATIKVVADDPSDRARGLPNTAKINERSRVIFGTGDRYCAVTVTANNSFVRAAEHQGVFFTVHLHPSRVLTEMKEKTAISIQDPSLKSSDNVITTHESTSKTSDRKTLVTKDSGDQIQQTLQV